MLILIVASGILLFGTIFEACAAEENWPQWRGLLRTGTAPNADPPIEWSETKNIRWQSIPLRRTVGRVSHSGGVPPIPPPFADR